MDPEIIIPEDLEPDEQHSKGEGRASGRKDKVRQAAEIKLRQLPALKVPESLYNKLALECFERNIKMKTLLLEIVYDHIAKGKK